MRGMDDFVEVFGLLLVGVICVLFGIVFIFIDVDRFFEFVEKIYWD